jgi:tetratricopeptide (TPR) repeat protein
MSDRDIEAGQRWNEQISLRLKDTSFGIVCLTSENLNAPWILFEAGALAKSVDSARVVPVLLGVRKADITFPLAQFQAVEADRDGIWDLILALNRGLGEDALQAETLRNIFEGLWGRLETAIAKISAPTVNLPASNRRSEREVLEDVLEGVRQVQRALASRPAEASPESSVDWQDFYIRGVSLANRRGNQEINIAALRSYSEAIALAPIDLEENTRSRLHAYRGAILKRLKRLSEAEQDLLLARKWARERREIDDADYNLAGVFAMQGRLEEAINVLTQLIDRSPEWYRIVREKNEYFGNLAELPEFRQMATMGQ